ncbi:hypothetical protein [Xylophilus sp. GOD-11R]|uniref:hypothetical protein n=1 Tax=Xylophilus sp. GOD-11R TaxID=3089814 RepID=UPI00298CC174|nr:hypothetical protein [Xylophilus sp. GOD-11R]WPB59242.1 hypothetical protein R9X41_11575 [Xylophilus sp. GOD-11R]
MKYRQTSLGVAVLACFSAYAADRIVTGQEIADRGAPFDLAQTRTFLAAGAEVEHTAPGTGNVRRWKQSPDGTLIASSRAAGGKPVTASGTWTVRDDGRYCLTIAWTGRDESSCYRVYSLEGNAYLASSQLQQNADRRYGQVVVSGLGVPVGAGVMSSPKATEPEPSAAPAEATAAAAPAARTYLGADDVRKEFVDHVVVHQRQTDGNKGQWDVRGNGMVYGANLSTNGKDTGNWTIEADGALCMKWRGNTVNGCYYTFRDGDHWARTTSAAPDAPVYYVINEVR